MTRSGAEKSPRLATTKFSSTPLYDVRGVGWGWGAGNTLLSIHNNITCLLFYEYYSGGSFII